MKLLEPPACLYQLTLAGVNAKLNPSVHVLLRETCQLGCIGTTEIEDLPDGTGFGEARYRRPAVDRKALFMVGEYLTSRPETKILTIPGVSDCVRCRPGHLHGGDMVLVRVVCGAGYRSYLSPTFAEVLWLSAAVGLCI